MKSMWGDTDFRELCPRATRNQPVLPQGVRGLPSVVAWKWSKKWCLGMLSILGKYSSTWNQWSKALLPGDLRVLDWSQCNECSGVRWQDQGHTVNLGQSQSWKVGTGSTCSARVCIASIALSCWICTEVPMAHFFPEAPRALAVLFSHSGQTWAWAMGLLLVSPGKWLGGNKRTTLWVWH